MGVGGGVDRATEAEGPSAAAGESDLDWIARVWGAAERRATQSNPPNSVRIKAAKRMLCLSQLSLTRSRGMLELFAAASFFQRPARRRLSRCVSAQVNPSAPPTS